MSAGRLIVFVLQWAVAWALLWRVPTPRRTRASTDRPAVIIPARNEADNLGRLLPSLAGADAEVIVVDDGSTDGTGEVASAHGATVVEPGEPDPGWTGKAWACAAGARASSASRLVFLDADVVVEPGGLDRVLAEHDDVGGLVSVQPWHAVERPYEQLSAPFNLVGMLSIDAFTPWGRRLRPTGAFGPCLVIDRSDYDEAGGHGHESVRGAVLDDVALARAVQRTGRRVTVLGGRGSLRFRMYPHGLESLVEGWTKNIAGGAAGTRPLTFILVFAWITGAWAAVLHPVVYLAYAFQIALLLRRIGSFSPLVAIAYPVPLLFFLGVLVHSSWLTIGHREVAWRGRRVRT